MPSILFIALRAILRGMDTCEDFVRFAKAREDWLKQWIALPDGIPCGNTFLRVFAAIDPVAFSGCLTIFVKQICPELAGRLVAIDGKAPRGSRKSDRSTVQIFSARSKSGGNGPVHVPSRVSRAKALPRREKSAERRAASSAALRPTLKNIPN